MLVAVFANPHSFTCLRSQRGGNATFVKTHRAGFPLVNLTRNHVYLSEGFVNIQLLHASIPASCPHAPVPRLLMHNDVAMRLTFEFVPPALPDAIPNGSQLLAQATCLNDFLVRAGVTHGDLGCKHLLWVQRSGAVHLMLVDFDMATFEHSNWNVTARQTAILEQIQGKLRRAQALLRARKLAKGALWFAEVETDAQSSKRFKRFTQFVGKCAKRRRQGLDQSIRTTEPLRCKV